MHATLIPRAEGRVVPWGNGLGTSREIILEQTALEQTAPQRAPPHLLWRLATTRIEADCPFSPYPGQDRIIVLLKGNGFELTHESANPQSVTARYGAIHFGGDWGTHCRLIDGPVEVLNVMASRGQVSCSIALITVLGEAFVQRLSKVTKALYVLDGKLSARLDGEAELALREGDTVRLEIDAPRGLHLRAWGATVHLLILEAQRTSPQARPCGTTAC